MEDNVCKFLSTRKSNEHISIINFVYEREANFKQDYLITSIYTMALVTSGIGTLHTTVQDFPLSKGSLFFTFSAKPYYIENSDHLQYIYIGFTGLRALTLLERLHVGYATPIYTGFDFLIPLWEKTMLDTDESNTDLFCEGLLLYTAGFICSNNSEPDCKSKKNGILLAKQYVDLNYTNPELTLEFVSQHFSYDPKYFSSAFKKLVRANFSDYLKNRRLNYAVSLIESGITNIKDLAELCGYNDPIYFSKCFKAKYGVSPKKFKNPVKTATD